MSARFRAALLASTVLAAPAFAQQIGAPISQLPSAALPLSGTEPVPLVQGGVTVKAPASAFGGGVSPTTPITPNGSIGSYTLGVLTSPTNFMVPRGHIGIWMPLSGNPNFDSTPAIFWNGSQSRTWVGAFEVPADVTAAELVMFNHNTASITLTDAAIWGSSQLAAPGYTQTTPGVTPYDGSGNALTYMTLFSFANGGADSVPNFGFQTTVPASATSATTSGTTSLVSSTLNFSTLTCPPNGSTIQIINDGTAVQNPALYANTTVISCVANTSITMSSTPREVVNSGVTVYFAPPGFTLGGVSSTNCPPYPLFCRAWSDWAPLTTYARIDGPVMAGMTILQNGSPLAGTVSSTTATTAVMTGNLVAGIPAGSALQSCQVATISGTFTPVNQLSFANTVTNILPGMLIWPSAGNNGPKSYFYAGNSVQSVATSTNTVVTLTNSVDGNQGSNVPYFGSGSTFGYGLYGLVSAASGSTITVPPSVAGSLSSGMSIFQGNGAIGVSGASYSATISGVNATTGVVTMSAPVPATIVPGMNLLFYATANLNAATSNAVPAYATPPTNVYQGMTVVGSNVPSPSYVYYYNNGIAWTRTASAPLVNGQTVYFCNNVTTAGNSPAGQPNINFSQTTYRNRLVLVRANFSTANVNYYGLANSAGLARWHNLDGNPQDMYGGVCNAGVDGVLSIASVGNSAGGCSQGGLYAPFQAIKFYSESRGVIIANVGDSHAEGDTTTMGYANYATRTAYALSQPGTLPVWTMNVTWGGEPSGIFAPNAMQMFRSAQPQVAFVPVSSNNDGVNTQTIANMEATSSQIMDYVREYGGLPVLVTSYSNQTFGIAAWPPTSSALVAGAQAYAQSVALTGTPVLDLGAIAADPTLGVTYINPLLTHDGVHMDDSGHYNGAFSVSPPGGVPLLKPYMRY